MTEHVTREILQLMADGELAEEIVQSARSHLVACASCRKTYQGLVRFDHLMRNLPERSLPQEFTNSVLQRVGIQPRTPLLFRVVEQFAPLVALILVTALGGTLWAILALPASQSSGDQFPSRYQVLDVAGRWMESSWSEFSRWMQRALLMLPQTQAAKIFLMIVLAAFVVAMIDRIVQRRGEAGRP